MSLRLGKNSLKWLRFYIDVVFSRRMRGLIHTDRLSRQRYEPQDLHGEYHHGMLETNPTTQRHYAHSQPLC